MSGVLEQGSRAATELDAFFAPRSVALVGVSSKPGNMFSRPLQYLIEHGFPGAIHPVNPKVDELMGLPCAPSLSAIGAPVDLVLILVPARHAAAVVRECGAVGARAAIVFSSGFAETGPEGRVLQDELLATAREAGVRLLGPNCQGLIFAPQGLAATFTAAAGRAAPAPGGLAFVGQSGALGGAILDLAAERGLGLTAWVSVGNEADCDVAEIGTAVIEREAVELLAVYVESVGDGARLERLAARAAQLGKPLVLLRAGRTAAGWRAAVSHTGALERPGEALDAVARRHGVVTVEDVDELVEVGHALARHRRGAGSRIAVLTSSGGAGSLIADHLDAAGLQVEPLSADVQERLTEYVPAFGAVANPVDVTAQLFQLDGRDLETVCATLRDDPGVDQVVVILTMLTGAVAAGIAESLVRLTSGAAKPIHLCWLGGREQNAQAREILRASNVPVYGSLRGAVRAAAAVAAAVPAPAPTYAATPDPAFAALPALLTEWAAQPLLAAAGVPAPRARLVTDAVEAAAAVEAVGGRAVCKLQSPAATHKSEHGLVRLDVGPADAERVVAELLAAGGDGVLVQEQAPAGLELLVGITRTAPGLPPLLTVGHGGVLAEVWRDAARECLPVSAQQVQDMLLSLRCAPLLRGFRGRPAHDLAAAVGAIGAIARAADLLGDRLLELEVNPLIVQPASGGALAADVLVRLRP